MAGRGMERFMELLYQLGVTANYTGFFHTAYALQLCVECPERLLLVTKWLYPDVAKCYETTWKAVERNIRTVISVIWKKNQPLLEYWAHGPLSKKPCSAQFLSIVSATLLRGEGRVVLDSGLLAHRGLGQTAAFFGEDGEITA